MLIICFEPNVLVGGLGDRIVGIVATKIMAELLNQNFYIEWSKENIREYINYDKYDFSLQEQPITNNVVKYHLIDNQYIFKNELMTSLNLFPNVVNKLNLNLEISQYLFKNNLFSHLDYNSYILNTYKSLYTDILKPTLSLLLKINIITRNVKKITGIQIRAGDSYMKTNTNETHCRISDPDKNILEILQNIKKHNDNDNYIFLTSDYSNIYELGKQVWDSDKILYCDDEIQHIDRARINDDFSKVFADSYILSQLTQQLYISTYSNFGIVSALSCLHDEVYGLDCNKINKTKYFSKHENLFCNN